LERLQAMCRIPDAFRIRVIRVIRGLIFLGCAAVTVAGIDAQESADLVLRGGKVITLADSRPEADAIAIRGDRIIALGSAADVQPLIAAKTRIIELAGRTAMPGFIEGHGHFFSLGDSKRKLDLSRAASWDEVIALVAAEAKKTPPGQWIVGRGWHQGKWTSPPTPNVQGYPTHEALSRATPDHPVLLTHGTGHMTFANAKAMELAGVSAKSEEIAGGEILRDAAGSPTGAFRENASRPIHQAHARALANRTPEQQRADTIDAAQLAAQECIKHGVTSFQDAGSTTAEVDLLRSLAEEGNLPLRLWIMLDDNNDVLARKLADYRLIGAADNHITVRAIKRLFDGAIGTHGAWLLAPYNDLPSSIGNNTLPLPSLERTAELAWQHNYQLCVHAIGDRANREVLDLFERVFAKHRVDGAQLRWRIEHAQHLDLADIPRFKQLGVIASMQANHATSDGPFVVARLGERRARLGAYAWRSLLDAGAVVTNGTDVPVEPVNPLGSFYASVTRKMADGEPFFPEQCMTRGEALRSYTRDAAYAAFEENEKGTLAAGKLADMVVLTNNLRSCRDDEILTTRVDLTIVGGKIVFDAAKSTH
jgi:predicted amidohydrolase YtcJ